MHIKQYKCICKTLFKHTHQGKSILRNMPRNAKQMVLHDGHLWGGRKRGIEFRRKTQGTSKVSIMFYFFKLHTGHRGICYITDSLFCRLRSSLVISGLVGRADLRNPLGLGLYQFLRGVAMGLWARNFTYLSLFRSVKLA